jgi:hypothetical protein
VFSGHVGIQDSVLPPQPPSRRHPERPAADHQHDQERGPQQPVGGEPRAPGLEADIAADDRRDGAQHRDRDAQHDVQDRDDHAEPPGRPSALAQPPHQEGDEEQREADADEVVALAHRRPERAVVGHEVHDHGPDGLHQKNGDGDEPPLPPAGPVDRGRE